uniref:Putative secreted protein n=1 Tax=Anopheles darlingi TaxID=43151 RepID=A0A2M4DG78_ANODA
MMVTSYFVCSFVAGSPVSGNVPRTGRIMLHDRPFYDLLSPFAPHRRNVATGVNEGFLQRYARNAENERRS